MDQRSGFSTCRAVVRPVAPGTCGPRRCHHNVSQIEDPEALDRVDHIARIGTIAPPFLIIGRGDLAVAFGANSSDAPEGSSAAELVSKAARAAGEPVMVFVSSNSRDAGAICEIDVHFLRIKSNASGGRESSPGFRGLAAIGPQGKQWRQDYEYRNA